MIEVEITLIIFGIHQPTCCHPALSHYSLHCTARGSQISGQSIDHAIPNCHTQWKCSFLVVEGFQCPNDPGSYIVRNSLSLLKSYKSKLVQGRARQRPQKTTEMNISNRCILPRGSAGSHTGARLGHWTQGPATLQSWCFLNLCFMIKVVIGTFILV